MTFKDEERGGISGIYLDGLWIAKSVAFKFLKQFPDVIDILSDIACATSPEGFATVIDSETVAKANAIVQAVLVDTGDKIITEERRLT